MTRTVLAHHARSLAYNDWANAEVLAALRAWEARVRRRPSGEQSRASIRARQAALRRARLLFAHIVAAEFLWLGRVAGEPPTMPVWPDLDLDTCEELLAQLARAWHETLRAIGARGLDRQVAYVNSKGEAWHSSTGDILSQVVVHAAYHRGQIAALVRGARLEPPLTDFIHCARSGYIVDAIDKP